MPVDRRLWQRRLAKTYAPSWPCPTCRKGVLRLDRESMASRDTAETRRGRRREDWTPELDMGRFIAFLVCDNKPCAEVVTVTGRTFPYAVLGPENEMEYDEEFVPVLMDPPAPFIDIPEPCPTDARRELIAAFRLVWVDPNAAGNRIRASLEHLLDAVRVPRKRRTANGRFERLTLHRRIEVFREKNPALGDSLLAVKWLGNIGSHEAALKPDDLFDAFDILEHAIIELWAPPSKAIKQLAAEINRRKGPRSRVKRHRPKKKASP